MVKQIALYILIVFLGYLFGVALADYAKQQRQPAEYEEFDQ